MEEQAQEDMIPRNYQVQLMQIAVRQNTIIFLPTGSGKTFIAVMVLKQLSAPLARPYSASGKISVILVNTVALVEQHARVLRNRTHFEIGEYSGDMNVDNWSKEDWLGEFNKNQVLVMTCQILVNLCNNGYLDLQRVNLLVFDECHHGVKDQPMRQIMRTFGTLAEQPRVLGLTATLLNANTKPANVMKEVAALEVTYHGKVATVEELRHVIGFATNPCEQLKPFNTHRLSAVELWALGCLEEMVQLLEEVKIDEKTPTLQKSNLQPLDPDDGLRDLINLVKDLKYHAKLLGTFGLLKAVICYIIQVERLIRHCEDVKLYCLLSYVNTIFTHIKNRCEKALQNATLEEKIRDHLSDQVKSLLEIFREFRSRSNQELCSIIFVERRFTAKILYHIWKSVVELPEFEYIKPDFIVGFQNNPYNVTRESLYISKQNRKTINSFCKKETNLIIASSVLEEGIDIPNCTLVVKFDKPMNYRSYIQSKGRARHKESFYYVQVKDEELRKFCESYETYREVEQILNKFLVGQNDVRSDPARSTIEAMYDESIISPYIVGSARVDMLSAIALLSQYCQGLSADKYTVHAPEWYLEELPRGCNNKQVRVVILLPVLCRIREPIVGPFMNSKKYAKRAAALITCIKLHKMGELDDDLKPKRASIEEDTEFLFEHWPAEKEKEAGNTKTKRLYSKRVPDFCRGQLHPHYLSYLHIVHLTPRFLPGSDVNLAAMLDVYRSDLCYGLLTPNPLPAICDFPVYVSAGQIDVQIQVNTTEVCLSAEQIRAIRGFHTLVFNEVLRVLQEFLMMDNGEEAQMMVLVPVRNGEVDFEVVERHVSMEVIEEPSRSMKKELVVTAENYLGKIVTPWYRIQETHYLVTRVCEHLNSSSSFPLNDFATFADYYYEKYKIIPVQPDAPLLLVKGISKRLNCIKPRGLSGKRRKDVAHEELDEYLIAELCIKHELPASLFIQASLMPTVLFHLGQQLVAEELRQGIARETGVGMARVGGWEPLRLDEHLLRYEYKKAVEPEKTRDESVAVASELDDIGVLNRDVSSKMLEAEYPWKDIEEPKNIDKDIDVTVMDIIMYEMFVCGVATPVKKKSEYLPVMKNQNAITYDKHFEEKHIEMLTPKVNHIGPQLRDIYTCLCTAKSNGLVNLERLETLGDSFLKLTSSLYIITKYPNYDEGRATTLKSKLISNKNLFYLGRAKNLGGCVLDTDLFPNNQWLPPGFTVPKSVQEDILNGRLSVRSLYDLFIPSEEQISGVLGEETLENIRTIDNPIEENEELASSSAYLKLQSIGDKTIADCVEALIGAYFQSNGFVGGVRFMEWMGIIPKSENLLDLLSSPPPNPILSDNVTPDKIDFHIPHWQTIEQKLGYKFKNRAFLLQALTHASYSCNRITYSYERLEFLGDAVLDFLITCFIYERCGHLDPGEITDLRSALVNNTTFASYTVRHGLHKFLLNLNQKLAMFIDTFAEFQEGRNHVIDDTVMILLQEQDYNLAEHIDVPKALGDVFEALAGAVYLDSGKDLNTVWRVFYKIMWKEIDLFSNKVPKNVVRLLHEKVGVHPKFQQPVEISGSDSVMVRLEFILDGARKYVHGFGENKTQAKRAAAKIALRLLEKSS